MEFIRVFTNPRRSMQRFGFLKYLVWRASISATNNLSTLGKDLISAVSQKVSVVLTPHLQEYIMTALTDSIYGNLRSIAAKPPGDTLIKPTVQVEIQDLYLSDAELPSRRGKLVSDDWNRYPHLALDLGLVRRGTYSLLVRGQSFLSLVSEGEQKTFSVFEARHFSKDLNPFKLSMPQKLLLLFSLIERDGEVLNRLYKKLLSLAEPFTDKDAGDYLPEIYRNIAKEFRPKVKSADDLLRIQKLLDTAEKIEAVRHHPSPGGKNPREHGITVRLEPFVDIGLLSKLNPFAYLYQINEATKASLGALVNSESIEHFLHNSFFDATDRAFALNADHRTDRETIWPAIQKAYSVLKSPLGYAPILEISLLAGIYSITETGVYFEISESLECLKMLQKERPEHVRFNVDRWGALTFVKFNDAIMKDVDT